MHAIHALTMDTWIMVPLPFDESLSDALAQFRLHGLASGHSARTIDARDATIRRLRRDVGTDLREVTEEQLVQWLAGLELRRSSRATYRAHLVAFFKWLRKTGRRQDDPAYDLPSAKAPRAVPHPASLAGVAAVLAACADRRARTTRAYVLLMAYEGMRPHEVAKVRGEDFTEGLLWIDGKGGTRLPMPVHPLVAEIVEVMPPAGYWFPSPSSAGHVSRVSVSLAIRRAMKRAEIIGKPYDLRHHFGTQVLKSSGGNLRTAQRALRHAQPGTTAIYTLVPDDDLFRAVAGIPTA